MTETFLAGGLIALLVTWLVTPLVKRLALRWGAVDLPNQRKVHDRVMPRLGGIAIYIGFVVALWLIRPLNNELLGLLLGGTAILLVGMLDDLRGLPPVGKLVGQIAAAAIVVAAGVRVEFVTHPFSLEETISLGWLTVPVTIFWIIGVTNAVNLIDGLDGLAAGVSAIAAATLAVVAWKEGQMLVVYCALVLAASSLGFLRHNFHPAKIFMGDSGAMFLGYNLSVLAILGLTKSATTISLFIPVVILGIPLLDTSCAIIRRYVNNQPIFQADKAHLHHRLLAMGFSHRQTVLMIYAVNLVLGASAILLTQLTTPQGTFILLALSMVTLIGANKLGIIGRGPATSRKASGKAKQPSWHKLSH